MIETGCISVGVWAEGSKTVGHETQSIANVRYQHLRDTDCHSYAYSMLIMIDQKYVAKVPRSVTEYVRLLSVSVESINKFNICGQ